MCGLCGLLGEDVHWSDPLGDEWPRRRERLRRIAAINRVLAPFRLKVEDVHGASYLLLGATGRQNWPVAWSNSGVRPSRCSGGRWTPWIRRYSAIWSTVYEHCPERNHRVSR